MATIVLHQWSISPFCGKIRKLLDYKGLAYSVVEYGGVRALKVKSLTGVGKLPVLDFDGERVHDSGVIARFLEAKQPSPSILPVQVDRDLAHLLEDWADSSLYRFAVWMRLHDEQALALAVAEACADRPSYEHFAFKIGFKRACVGVVGHNLLRYPAQDVLGSLQSHLDALEGRLSRHAWLAGDAACIADIAVSAQLDELHKSQPGASMIQARPLLSAWLARSRFDRRPQDVGAERNPGQLPLG